LPEELYLANPFSSWALLRRCAGRSDDTTDAESDTESATTWNPSWREEHDIMESDDNNTEHHSAATALAKRHRKRLKRLEQLAPSQSLGHWRAEKKDLETQHVPTFATAVSATMVCAICLDVVEDDSQQIRELHCGHVFHSACLDLWVERGHHNCPLCKYDILLGLVQPEAAKVRV
jgi:hypothetical protein